jgi:hypothetical protein
MFLHTQISILRPVSLKTAPSPLGSFIYPRDPAIGMPFASEGFKSDSGAHSSSNSMYSRPGEFRQVPQSGQQHKKSSRKRKKETKKKNRGSLLSRLHHGCRLLLCRGTAVVKETRSQGVDPVSAARRLPPLAPLHEGFSLSRTRPRPSNLLLALLLSPKAA